MYYANINLFHIGDIEKAATVTLPFFWVQDPTRTSEWEDSKKVHKALIIFFLTQMSCMLLIHICLYFSVINFSLF